MTDGGAPATSERRRKLLGIKLRALVSEHLGTTLDVEPTEFGTGAGLVVDGAAWVIVDGPAGRTLGASLAWAIRHGAASLDVVVEREGGQLARRATGFDFSIGVWFPEERTLLPVVAEPPPPIPEAAAEHLELIPLIEAGRANPLVERGIVTGDVRGLEVCRVVDEPTVGNFAELNDVPADMLPPPAEGVILEVGVGANDREAFQLMHGHLPKVEALADVVASVTALPQHRVDPASAQSDGTRAIPALAGAAGPEHSRPLPHRAGRPTRAATEHEAPRTVRGPRCRRCRNAGGGRVLVRRRPRPHPVRRRRGVGPRPTTSDA